MLNILTTTTSRYTAVGVVAVLLALLAAPSATFAHERRTIASGKYDVVVGWDVEPAYVGQKNAVSIRISKPGTDPAQPVLGAEKTLSVDVRQGSTTRNFPLRTVFNQPGSYLADILPTRDGDIQFTFKGTIGDDQVNEQFDSADGKFDKIAPTTDLQFPVAAPDPVQVNAELQSARSAVATAQTVGTIGAGLGALGLLAAIGVWLTRPKHASAPPSAARRPVEERAS